MNFDNIFKPEVKNIKQLLSNTDSFYKVPDYQRPYSWENEQVEQLWDDIFDAFERSETTYFLGAIILIKTSDNYFEIVDGQQRLTTITILLCVLRDLYFKDNKVIINCIKSLVNDEFRLRLITQSHYQNKFENEILKKIKFPTKRDETKERQKNLFINSAIIFRDKLASIKNKNIIKNFSEYLLNQVLLITITSANQPFAIKLFQVLNTRGLELNNADLIKSFLYSKSNPNELDQLKATWAIIENIAEDVETDVDGLLTLYCYYLIERNPKKSIYEELVTSDLFRKKTTSEILHDFKGFVDSYKVIFNKKSKTNLSLWYLPNSIYWQSIITTAKHIKYKDIDDLTYEIFRLYYIYWIAGYTISKIKQLSFNIISIIKANKPIATIKKEINTKIKNDKVNEYFKNNINDDDLYHKRWLKPLLIIIEYFRTDDSKLIFIPIDKNLHVEHILPEKWDKNSDWKKLWSIKEANEAINKLGNLTIISGNKNIISSNKSFEEKKRIYKSKHNGMTAFELSKEVAALKKWTIKEFKERHNSLIKEISKIFQI